MVAILVFILTVQARRCVDGLHGQAVLGRCRLQRQQIGLVSVNLGPGALDRRRPDRRLVRRHARHLPGPVGAGPVAGLVEPRLRGRGVGRAACWRPARRRRWCEPLHQAMVYSASALESFTGGLGTGAFLAFLMAITSKREGDHRIRHPVQHLRVQPRRGGLGRRHRRSGAGLRGLLLSDFLPELSRPTCCCRRSAGCWNSAWRRV